MAYSEWLANRLRALLSDPDDEDAALARPHARPMDFTARPMRGFVTVAREGLKGQALREWVALAVAHAETQPPKQPKRKAVRR
jgi:hypothetical protein